MVDFSTKTCGNQLGFRVTHGIKYSNRQGFAIALRQEPPTTAFQSGGPLLEKPQREKTSPADFLQSGFCFPRVAGTARLARGGERMGRKSGWEEIWKILGNSSLSPLGPAP